MLFFKIKLLNKCFSLYCKPRHLKQQYFCYKYFSTTLKEISKNISKKKFNFEERLFSNMCKMYTLKMNTIKLYWKFLFFFKFLITFRTIESIDIIFTFSKHTALRKYSREQPVFTTVEFLLHPSYCHRNKWSTFKILFLRLFT